MDNLKELIASEFQRSAVPIFRPCVGMAHKGHAQIAVNPGLQHAFFKGVAERVDAMLRCWHQAARFETFHQSRKIGPIPVMSEALRGALQCFERHTEKRNFPDRRAGLNLPSFLGPDADVRNARI